MKFRVWHKADNWQAKLGWLYPNQFVIDGNGRGLLYNGHTYDSVNEDDFVVQQAIGIKDKNGIEIYEGDIVSIGETYPKLTVEFNERIGAFTFSGLLINTNSGRCINSRDVLVLGNIFENPNLLKV